MGHRLLGQVLVDEDRPDLHGFGRLLNSRLDQKGKCRNEDSGEDSHSYSILSVLNNYNRVILRCRGPFTRTLGAALRCNCESGPPKGEPYETSGGAERRGRVARRGEKR
jgi:hypothetical protein